MNNENGELSDVKTQKKPSKQLRKPVKRLDAEVRGVVTPENVPETLGNPSTAPAVKSRHTLSRRSSMAYKNFLGKFKRANPGRLTAEASSIWRKMSLQEKEQFRMDSTDRHKTSQGNTNSVDNPVAEEVPPLEVINDIESESQIHTDQLEETSVSNTRSWLSLNCVSKALSKAKNLFS
ncbi:uncharacterized protein LOC119546521 [Drosophila subpulchrella]|uniref:uncharacterized protein LOC119546521 n=1 Tax=Drosophila subpulchrella TaxID=1486046 RepID=UPI0018A14C8C|nr:uncharacterized protein LOC119546521 [Drosophila subpulchrella]XP_037708784.1 uncharacterized protein LOC119546521 [Drosophila subpulchrella]